jgi:hypothetical protein
MRGAVYSGEPIESVRKFGADELAEAATNDLVATFTSRALDILEYYLSGMSALRDGSQGKRGQAVHRHWHLDEAATAEATFDVRKTPGNDLFLM